MRPARTPLLLVLAAAAAAQVPATISPAAGAAGPGTDRNWYPFGSPSVQYQQMHDDSSFSAGGARTVRRLRFRPSPANTAAAVDMELFVADCPHRSVDADPSFAANAVPGTEVRVLSRRRVDLPAFASLGWNVSLPFDVPFAWRGGHLSWRAVVHGNYNGNQPTLYAMDGFRGQEPSRPTGSFAGCASALGTGPARHWASVFSPGWTARFDGESNVPSVRLPALLLLGRSDRQFGGVPLPFDLGRLGATGCQLTNDVLLAAPGLTAGNAVGSVSFLLPLAYAPRMAGTVFHTQLAFAQPGANALDLFFSGGLTHTIAAGIGAVRVYGSVGATRADAIDPGVALVIGLD